MLYVAPKHRLTELDNFTHFYRGAVCSQTFAQPPKSSKRRSEAAVVLEDRKQVTSLLPHQSVIGNNVSVHFYYINADMFN
jgi:hypothetical protein